MNRFKPTLWLSFGLVSLTLAIALTAYVFGFMPDGRKAEIDARAKVAESIAVQLAGAVNRKDTVTLKGTMDAIVKRNSDILSSALRNASGKVVLSAGDHEKHWVLSKDGKSTPTHVSVPLIGESGNQGTIEISFGPPTSGKSFLGIPASLLLFFAFLTGAGFIGYFLILRRTLKELDPSRVIPERVQKAFDTLSEGVIILDEKERILLVNGAFADMYGKGSEPLLGSKINHLPWRMVDGAAKAGGYPWHTALREGREMREGALSLRSKDGKICNFNVNATVIMGDKDKSLGAIVTLRDMTGAKRTKEDLDKAIEELQKMQGEVKRQNRELTYLSNHDALTGCLNRRSFFAGFQTEIEESPDLGTPFSAIMISFDQYKSINESFGPVAGDALIINVANLIKAKCGSGHYVSRHASDKFCVAAVGLNETDTSDLIKSITKEIGDSSRQLLPAGEQATISIGVTHRISGSCTAHTMAHRADQALEIAKESGSNQTVLWTTEVAKQTEKDESTKPSIMETKKPTGASKVLFPSNTQNAGRELSESEKESITASHDKTNFYNKATASIALAEKNNKPIAVLQMSLDSWDYLGEALGDKNRHKLVDGVEQRIVETLRENDGVLSLVDNGEWLIELTDLDAPEDANWIVKRLIEAMSDPIQIAGELVYVTSKIGIALFPKDGRDVKSLVRNARVALRRAVEEQRLESFKFYSSEMPKSSKERLNLETGIRNALQNNGFELYFQPIVDATTGELTAAEALLRCHNEQLKGTPIYQVIQVAEQSSLITEIDMWVLKQALIQQQAWCDAGLNLPKVSINLSAKQLNNIEFMDEVFETIKAVKFSPSQVQIEVTETAELTDIEVAAPQLKRLQTLGVQIALDDFGTGQTSLTYLQRLHPDVLKIDGSFITGVNTNHANATMVSAMIVMSHCLGLKVVAEGVEEQEQLEFLRETNCDEIQGYLISRPMPVIMMGEWMKTLAKEKPASPIGSTPKIEAEEIVTKTKAA
ncbi:MAG: EAL domain-containing protein [Rhizobiaceae bacterium]